MINNPTPFTGGTVSNSVILNGTNNTAPNQVGVTPGAASLLVRDQAVKEAFYNAAIVRNAISPAFSASGTGATASVGNSGWEGTTGTSNSGYSKIQLFKEVNIPGGTGATVTFYNNAFSGIVVFGYSGPGAINGKWRIWFGDGTAPQPADSNALATAGCGVEFGDNGGNMSFRFFRHDGTTFSTGSWVATSATPSNVYLFFYSVHLRYDNGIISGGFEASNGVFQRSFTAIPTISAASISAAPAGGMYAAAVNPASGAFVTGSWTILQARVMTN